MVGKINTVYHDYFLGRGGNLPVFRGHYYPHTGYGIGGIISGLFRSAIPLLKPLAKKVAKATGKELLRGGTKIFSDVMEGKNLKSAIKSRGLEGISNLAEKAFRNRSGASSRGRKRKATSQKKRHRSNKLAKSDIFDLL
jgi:hypothetical protein